MWGDYGPQYDVTDNEYLAEISTVSRDIAEDVMLEEYAKQNVMRRWLFDVITACAWGYELHEECGGPGQPECPFCVHWTGPVVKVRATARAAKRMIAEIAESEDLDPFDVINNEDPEVFARHVLVSQALVEELSGAAADYAKEIQHKRTLWAKELEGLD
jgi:hypothetical protein